MVVLGLIGKFAKLSGGIDMDNALLFYYASSATYLGRKITNTNKDSTTEINKE
jgi:hypothetical protein